MRAEQVTGPVARHGEGPIWDDGASRLRFVDIASDAVLEFTPEAGGAAGPVERRPQPETVTVLRPRQSGGWVLGTGSGFAITSAVTGAGEGAFTRTDDEWQQAVRLWHDPRLRMNDGGCDPAGRFYCGSMSRDFTAGAGTLYRLDPDLSVTPVLTGLTIPNGLAWSLAGDRAYFVDSRAGTIDVLRFDAGGAVTGRRTLVDVAAGVPAGCVPDGLTVDAAGGIWVAIYGAGEVRRYEPDGRLDAVVRVAVPKPTACTFGGPGYGDLFITTTQEDLDLAEHPDSGALFRIRIDGVHGLPALAFAG